MIDRRRARVLAFQALCQLEAQGEGFLSEIDAFLDDENPPADVVSMARRLSQGAWARREELDRTLMEVAENWDLQRMSLVDRNVLRLAACEMLESADVPAAVVINEALEIAREFGSAESPAFVNGVLDAVRKRRES